MFERNISGALSLWFARRHLRNSKLGSGHSLSLFMGNCGGQWEPPSLHPSYDSLFLGVGDFHPPCTSPWLVTCARYWGARRRQEVTRRRQEVTTKRAQEGIFPGTVCLP